MERIECYIPGQGIVTMALRDSFSRPWVWVRPELLTKADRKRIGGSD